MIEKKIYYLNYYRLIRKINAIIIILAYLTSLLRSINATIIIIIIVTTLLVTARLKKIYFNIIKINKLKILNFNNYYNRELINSQSEDYSTNYYYD